jgi:diguanylate cyclase (GGDEF)-like protein/PAS domain S-box-containing protein
MGPTVAMRKSSGNHLEKELLEHSIDAAVIIDEHSVIQYANEALENLSGLPRKQLVGAMLDCLLPKDLTAQHLAWIAEYCRRGGTSSVLGRVREMELRHVSGQTIPVELKAVDLGDRGAIRYFGAFIADLRARKAMEAERQRLIDRLEKQAMTDSLTELPNRRAFDSEISRTMAQIRRSAQPASVALLDIDRFKSVNDRFGHAAGDEVLRMIARVTPTILRAGDYMARVGGEEFGLLFPNTPVAQAIPVVERLREAIGANESVHEGAENVNVTVSVGLAALDPSNKFEVSWRRADMALYRAKRAGRNRIAVH